MQLHELRPQHKLKKKKRVGRGGKHGTYSGRGVKGQKARAGGKFPPSIREIIKRYPKLRGYRQRHRALNAKLTKVVLNVETLERKFNLGDKVSPEILLERKIIRNMRGRMPKVEILGKGEIRKTLIIEGCEVSKSAKEKIEKVGGTIK